MNIVATAHWLNRYDKRSKGELRRISIPRTRVNRGYLCGSGLLAVEDVLDLLKRGSRENVSDPQIRRPRVIA